MSTTDLQTPARDGDGADREPSCHVRREHHAAAVKELTGHSDSDSVLEREFADVSIARASEAIRDIDDALARMDAGTYGLCESCSAPIPLERLQAIPHARLCVACSGQRSSVLRSSQ